MEALQGPAGQIGPGREEVVRALERCYDPCCREREISVVDMVEVVWDPAWTPERMSEGGAGEAHATAAETSAATRDAAESRERMIKDDVLVFDCVAHPFNFVVRAPRQFAEWLGKLLFWAGEDKIIYGSEAPIWHPKWALDAFWDFEIPQDLVEGYGYPQLTEQAKRKILGENLLRLHGMDVDETRQSLNVAA